LLNFLDLHNQDTRAIVSELDAWVIGQREAKVALANAMRMFLLLFDNKLQETGGEDNVYLRNSGKRRSQRTCS
jgi:ATP-dependent protease HslVU (ClpYQ) ATPase subunit